MDPDTCLQELLTIAKRIHSFIDTCDDDTIDLADLGSDLANHVINLDEWIMKGGFLPARYASRK
jgi:hypothetical protein